MVNPEKHKKLVEKMQKYGIREKEIIEKFIRSSGRGGQNVNKTATCVYLKHLPTGVEVKLQTARSQALNRFLARRLLVEKIEARILGSKSDRQQRLEKLKRQKRRRSRRAREKILEDKKILSEKKNLRKNVQNLSV